MSLDLCSWWITTGEQTSCAAKHLWWSKRFTEMLHGIDRNFSSNGYSVLNLFWGYFTEQLLWESPTMCCLQTPVLVSAAICVHKGLFKTSGEMPFQLNYICLKTWSVLNQIRAKPKEKNPTPFILCFILRWDTNMPLANQICWSNKCLKTSPGRALGVISAWPAMAGSPGKKSMSFHCR